MVARPKFVDIACVLMTVMTAFMFYRALTPVLGTTGANAAVVIVSCVMALGFGLIFLAWMGKAWARYLILTWVLFPIVVGAVVEAPTLEVSTATLLYDRLKSNWVVWAYFVPCIALFLPVCNKWYRGSGYAAS